MMKKKTSALALVVCMLLAVFCGGCRENSEVKILQEGQYYTYYVNSSGTALISRIYEPQGTTTEEVISELLEQCQTTPTGGDGRRAIPGNVIISDPPTLEDRIVNLYFDTTYTTMDKVTELLCKAALAKTITQLDEVDYIRIYVNGEVYKGYNSYSTNAGGGAELPGVDHEWEDELGPLGSGSSEAGGLSAIISPGISEKTLWSGSDFLDNTGDDTNKYVQAELVLYFGNAEGKALEAEVREVVYSSTLSLERVVLNQLIEGPKQEGMTATLPKNLKVQGVSLRDGVCYVDFDTTFLEEPVNVTDLVEIYSIVNSLTELSNVLQVQFTVNGSTDVALRNNISLGGRFEKDLSLIAVPEETTEEIPESSEETPESTSSGVTESGTAESVEGILDPTETAPVETAPTETGSR